jgi:hypothetical protein
LKDSENLPHYIFDEIPSIFYSDLTAEPFKHCFQCDRELLNSGVSYIIEKAFKQLLPHQTKSTIFEYAMCLNCYEKIRHSFSAKSIENMQLFFGQRIDFEKRSESIAGKKDHFNVDHWISNCLVSDSPISELKEFQIACHCIGKNIIYDQFPYMISGEVMDEVIELISNQTQGEMDGFKDRLNRPSPEIEELFWSKKLLFV